MANKAATINNNSLGIIYLVLQQRYSLYYYRYILWQALIIDIEIYNRKGLLNYLI